MTTIDISQAQATIDFVGSFCQVGTALIAAAIGMMTYRYTRRQNALSLINQNNTLANLVNTTIIQSEDARGVLIKPSACIVGCPDDAILFMYLNYVHNTYRMHQIGAVSRQVWDDTLGACAQMVSHLRRDQIVRLLGRGYEARFQAAVLQRVDTAVPQPDVLATIRPRAQARSENRVLALVS